MIKSKLKLYFAGPLFTMAERLWNRMLTERIKSFLPVEIFLPQEAPIKFLDNGELDQNSLFGILRDEITSCDGLIVILDGADSDSGTSWEVGFAYAIEPRPFIIGVRTDFRTAGDTGYLNLMLSKSIDVLIEHFSQEDEYILSLNNLADKICYEIKLNGRVV